MLSEGPRARSPDRDGGDSAGRDDGVGTGGSGQVVSVRAAGQGEGKEAAGGRRKDKMTSGDLRRAEFTSSPKLTVTLSLS